MSSFASNKLQASYAEYTGVKTRVFVSDTVPTLLANNSYIRSGLIVHNETGVLYVSLTPTVSPTDYTYRLIANTTLEVPYSGPVIALKDLGSSYVQVTETR